MSVAAGACIAARAALAPRSRQIEIRHLTRVKTQRIGQTLGLFAKETLSFTQINSRSTVIQKYSQIDPFFSVLAHIFF
jgi:hypothetical protein